MRVLYITLNSLETNTSATLRNKALIKGLLSNDVKVDVLTIKAIENNSYFDSSDNFIRKINLIEVDANSGYKSIIKTGNGVRGRIKELLLPFLRKIYHSINLFDNTIYIVKKIRLEDKFKSYYNFIISSSDPKSSHAAAKHLIKLGIKYGKWIQYWGDPLSIDINNKSIFPKWYIKHVERKLFANSDKIIYVSPFTLTEQKKEFPKYANNMEFIPIPYFMEKHYCKDKLCNYKLGYFGDYNSNIRNILPMYEYCKLNNIEAIIVGNTNMQLKKTACVHVHTRLPQNIVDKLEAECDILICILNRKGTQIPGKLYHYAATTKPILVIIDGVNKDKIRNYLETFNRFVFCENDEDSIGKAIDYIYENDKEYFPSNMLNPKIIANKFISLI